MAKATGPLFGEKASGTLAGMVTFKTKGNMTIIQPATDRAGADTSHLSGFQQEFAAAMEAWHQIEPQKVKIKKRWYWRRDPTWHEWWIMWQTPAAPSNLTTEIVNQTNIRLDWTNNATNGTSNEIQRKVGVQGEWSLLSTQTAAAVTYTDTTTQAGTTYYYRVRVTNAAKESDWSNTSSIAVPQQQIPTAPSNLSATAISSSQIDLLWQDNSTNETGFKIYRKTGQGGTWSLRTTRGAGVTTYQNTGLPSSTTYVYRVSAYNDYGDSSYSNEAQATTLEPPPPPPPPTAPSNLSATVISHTQINLSWQDNSTNETGFKVYRKTGVGGTWALHATKGANVTTHQNTGLSPNTTYVYRITAYHADGESSYCNESEATTQQSPIPAQPTNLTATAISDSQINLTWTDNATDETAYYVERKTGAGGSWSQIATLSANANSYNNTGLSANTEYYYRVRCWNTWNYSSYSSEANATTEAASCVQAVELTYYEEGSWTSACSSTHKSGSYARYYSFTVAEQTVLYFMCESNLAATMYLLSGHGMNGEVITEDSNGMAPGSPLIYYMVDAGDYTLEFVPQMGNTVGDFILLMDITYY